MSPKINSKSSNKHTISLNLRVPLGPRFSYFFFLPTFLVIFLIIHIEISIFNMVKLTSYTSNS